MNYKLGHEKRGRAVALGFFDGIHLGHAALLRRIVEAARELDLTPTVLTFDIHPTSVIIGTPVPLINSRADREAIIRREFGIEDVLFLHFDDTIMHMPWTEFADRLFNDFNACHLVCGHNYSFGHRGTGTPARLREYCESLGTGCDVIPSVERDGQAVSSTFIRKLLAQGEMERAARFLGHPHTLSDTVRYGYRLGSTIGFPTINMAFDEGVLVPPHGVYATKAYFGTDPSEYIAVTNIGVRPTVTDEHAVSVESYILDFDGDLYGKAVRVDFFSFLRPERRFGSVDELKAQIAKDINNTKAYFHY